MNTTNENTGGGIGGHVLCSGKYEGCRLGDLDRSDRDEMSFEAYRGCSLGGDRSCMRLYIRSLYSRQLWINGKRERRGFHGKQRNSARDRSEERRVGQEGRSRWAPDH